MSTSLLVPTILLATFSIVSQVGAVLQTTGDLEVTNAVVNPVSVLYLSLVFPCSRPEQDGFERSAVTFGGGPVGTLSEYPISILGTLDADLINSLSI